MYPVSIKYYWEPIRDYVDKATNYCAEQKSDEE